MPCTQIAARVGMKKHAVQQLVHRNGLSGKVKSTDPSGIRFDWATVQAYYDAGHSRKECLIKFGMSPTAWDTAQHGKLKVRPKIPLEDFFSVYKVRAGSALRAQLVRIGWLSGRCSECGAAEWRNKPLVIQVHHIDGDRANNKLENLSELCPNCHTQTPNFCNKNKPGIRGTPTEELIRAMHAEGASDLVIASRVGCTPQTVASITRNWRRRYA